MILRRGQPVLLAALFVVCALGVSGADPKPSQPPMAQLFRPVSFNGFEDPKLTLDEALGYLGKRFDLSFEVNEEAFRQDGVANVGQALVAEKPIPKMAAASLDRILRTVLARLPVQGGATYMVRAEHVEITTRQAQVEEVWGKYQGPYLPLVNGDFQGRPLAEALRELAAQAGVSVVVDARVADRAKVPVTARFTNLPLDTAVRVLADMAGLRSYRNDNVLTVTGAEHNTTARPNPDAAEAVAGAVPGSMPQLGLFAPVRAANFDKRPLDEALQDVLRPTGLRLVVDTPRAGGRAKAPVTANLDGTSVDTAVRLLADLGGLQAVFVGNVVYLTTKENGASFHAGLVNQPQFPGGVGLLGGAGIGGIGGGMGGLGLGGGAGGLIGGPR